MSQKRCGKGAAKYGYPIPPWGLGHLIEHRASERWAIVKKLEVAFAKAEEVDHDDLH